MASNQKLMEVELKMDAQAAIRTNAAFFDKLVADGRAAFSELTSAQKSELNKQLGGTEKTVIDLVWNTNTKQVEQSVRQIYSALDPIEAKIKKIEQVQTGSVTSLRQRLSNLSQERDSIQKIIVATDAYGKQVAKVNPEWEKQNKAVQRLKQELKEASASNFFEQFKAKVNFDQFNAVGKAINEIVQTFQSVFIIVGQITGAFNEVANSLRQVQEFELTFKAIGQGVEGGNAALQEAADIALRLGADLNTVQDGFKRLSPTVLQTGGTMQDVSAITESLASRFAVFGLNADESRRVMNGVIQAFGKGKFMAEEFTQQIAEADKAFATDFANALGVSLAKLYEMIENGEITTDVIRNIIPQMSKAGEVTGKLGDSGVEAALALGKIGVTVTQVTNQLNTLNTLNLRTFAQAFEPLIGAVFLVQGAITDLITEVLKLDAFTSFANIVNTVAVQIAVLITGITKVIAAILQFVGSIFTIVEAIDGWISSLIGVEPIIGLIATAITAKLVVALLGLAASAIPAAVTAIGSFVGALLNPASIIAGFSSVLGAVGTAITAYGASLIAQSTAQAASTAATTANTTAVGANTAALGAQATAAGAAAAAQGALGAAGGTAATGLTLANGAAVPWAASLTTVAGAAPGAAAGTAGVGTAAAGASGGLTAFATGLAAIATAAVGIVAVGVVVAQVATIIGNSYKGQKEFQDAAKTSLDSLNQAFEQSTNSSKTAAEKLSSFNVKLEEMRIKAEQGRNPLSQLWNFITNADATSVNAINNAIINVANASSELGDEFNIAIQTLRNYNEETDKGTDKQKQAEKQVTALINAYDGIISSGKAYLNAVSEQAVADGNLTAEEKKLLEQLKNNVSGLEQVRDSFAKAAEAKGLYNQTDVVSTMKNEVTATDELKYKLQDLKYARDLLKEKVTMELEIKVEGLEKLKEASQLRSQAVIKGLEQERDTTKANADAAVAGIDRQKRQNDFNHSVRKSQLATERSSEDLRHGQAIANLDAEKSKIEANRDSALRAIESRAAADQAASTARQAQLDAEASKIQQTASYEKDAAERAYQIKRLQREVSYTQDPRVRQDLQDQIALLQEIQRIEDEENRKTLANISAQAAAKAAAAQQEASAVQAKNAAEQSAANQLKAIEDKRRTEELAHEAKVAQLEAAERALEIQKQAEDVAFENQKVAIMEAAKAKEQALNAQIDAEKDAQQAREKAIDKQIADAKKAAKIEQEKYDKQIRELERQIELDSRKTAQNTSNAATAASRASSNTATWATNYERVAAAAERTARAQNSGGGGSTSSSSQPSIPGGARAGTTRTPSNYNSRYRGSTSRAAGGFLGGGMKAFVNELGQEAFLGRSGMLRMIDAPPWGLWKAPESGVVIPHNLTAGLNIPRGGVNLNTRGISGIGGGAQGGRITNHVTIQSTTPVKDATKMMIEMSKMRARMR